MGWTAGDCKTTNVNTKERSNRNRQQLTYEAILYIMAPTKSLLTALRKRLPGTCLKRFSR